MPQIERVTGTGLPLVRDDIDTDRIVPARYLRCVTFDGLGEHAFEDDRAQDPQHPFDDARYNGASILLAGRNFGCGSSREHAPQALVRSGIRAIVGESFAEIFFGNCTGLGLPCVCVDRPALDRLAARVEEDPSLEITVDLQAGEVRFADESVPFEMPESARNALLTGQYDPLAQLLEAKDAIRATGAKLPYLSNFA